MVRHAARALPWPLLAATAVLLAAMLRVVAEWPYTMWPLQGIAVGLLAGVAGFAYDEPAAAVVDSLPRGLAWRTAARTLGLLPLLAWWVAVVAVTSDAYFGQATAVASQGVAATAATVAAVSHLRRRGLATPAGTIAGGVVGGSAYVALARPLDDHLPVFPYTALDAWAASQQLWAAVLAGALVWLAVTLAQ